MAVPGIVERLVPDELGTVPACGAVRRTRGLRAVADPGTATARPGSDRVRGNVRLHVAAAWLSKRAVLVDAVADILGCAGPVGPR